MIFNEGALVAASCTDRVHEGPSIMEEIFPLEVHLRGLKNSDFFKEGSGSSRDSKGRKSHPLRGIFGCSEPHRTVLFEEGTTSGYLSSLKCSDLKINRSSSKSSTQLFSLRNVYEMLKSWWRPSTTKMSLKVKI